jgi:four helix bundle protein
MDKALIESFRDLLVWQRAMELSVAIYELTKSFPVEERFGLTNQLRRASVSIPSNIAEGFGRGTRKEYKQFLCVARGSALEVQTQLELAHRLSFGRSDGWARANGLADEVVRMLYGLIIKL